MNLEALKTSTLNVSPPQEVMGREVEVWYEDEYTKAVEEILPFFNVGTGNGEKYMFIHYDCTEKTPSIVKFMRKMWKKWKTDLRKRGWTEVYGYTKYEGITKLFKDWVYLGTIQDPDTGEDYGVYSCKI